VFRLSRVVGGVEPCGEPGTVVAPADIDVRALVGDWGGGGSKPRMAELLIRDGRANGLRRYAHSVEPEPARPGWDRVELNLFGTESLAGTVASFGADVIVADPPDLRDAVIRRLKGVLT
jgi:proteasome accessory factor B